MKPLCAGRDPEMWSPQSPDARLAMAICRRCVGCPNNDPRPHGVIRHGVPYGDSGQVMPLCPSCGRPQIDYRGGDLTVCKRCAVPAVAIPDPMRVRASKVRWLVGLGANDVRIAAEVGVSVKRAGELRRQQARAISSSSSTSNLERKAA